MKATDLLEKDHREVERLFARLDAAKSSAQKAKAFLDVKEALTLHAQLEEHVFYPAVRTAEHEAARVEVSLALDAHDDVKTLVAEIDAMSPSDPNFAFRCTELRDTVAFHVKDEEKDLFPLARRLLGPERLESLGVRMADARA